MCSKDKCTCGDKIDRWKLLEWLSRKMESICDKHGNAYSHVKADELIDDLVDAIDDDELS